MVSPCSGSFSSVNNPHSMLLESRNCKPRVAHTGSSIYAQCQSSVVKSFRSSIGKE